jgi:DivIVA domain-containing protein
MTPDDIRSQRFGTKLLGGLNPEEVTAFLEDVADAFDAVQKQKVAPPQGAHPVGKAPDAAVEHAAPTPRRIEANETAVTSRLEALRSAALTEVEALLHDAQLKAQALTEAASAQAAAALQETEALRIEKEREVEQLMAEARTAAEAIVVEAREREAALRGEIERLADSRLRLLDEVRTSVDAYREWLNTLDPRQRAMASGDRHAAETITNGAHAAS